MKVVYNIIVKINELQEYTDKLTSFLELPKPVVRWNTGTCYTLDGELGHCHARVGQQAQGTICLIKDEIDLLSKQDKLKVLNHEIAHLLIEEHNETFNELWEAINTLSKFSTRYYHLDDIRKGHGQTAR